MLRDSASHAGKSLPAAPGTGWTPSAPFPPLPYSCPSPGGHCPGGWTLSRRLGALTPSTPRGFTWAQSSFSRKSQRLARGRARALSLLGVGRIWGMCELLVVFAVCFLSRRDPPRRVPGWSRAKGWSWSAGHALGWKETPAVDAARVETSTDGAALQSCEARPEKWGHQETSCKLSAELWKTSQELQQEESPGSGAAPGMCPSSALTLGSSSSRFPTLDLFPAEVCPRSGSVGDAEGAPVLLQECTPGLFPLPKKLPLQRRNKRGPGQGVNPE